MAPLIFPKHWKAQAALLISVAGAAEVISKPRRYWAPKLDQAIQMQVAMRIAISRTIQCRCGEGFFVKLFISFFIVSVRIVAMDLFRKILKYEVLL